MPWNLLILPLIGGYYLLSRFNIFKYRQQRLDRQRLIFDTILVGLFLVILAFCLRKVFYFFIPELLDTIYSYFPIKTPFIGTTFASFIIAVIITELGNITFFRNQKLYIENAIKDVGNELELLLRTSLKQSLLLEFSLDTNKVYVAWVKELPIPTVTNYIRVIPVLSGFRDEEKRLNFTTHYLSVYAEYVQEGKVKDIEELDVDLIITLDNVVTVSYFDIEMYERFNKPVAPNDPKENMTKKSKMSK